VRENGSDRGVAHIRFVFSLAVYKVRLWGGVDKQVLW